MNEYVNLANELSAIGIKAEIDEPMSRHTSFKIGGPADVFVCAQTRSELVTVLKMCAKDNIPITLLGNGSNMLVSDEGIRGVVLSLDGDFCALEYIGDGIVQSGSGVMLSHLCQFAHGNSLTGLEFAFGIPGTVGGAVYMNAGAYGGEIKDVAISCEYMTRDGEIHTIDNKELAFNYRHSFFSDTDHIILSATFRLEQGDKDKIKSTMRELMGRRTDKQPLEFPSAGSVFKRPEGYFAGSLIEQSGLKGCTIGGAQVSTKHAGFIVNIGGATCADVEALVAHIQKTVMEKFGVALECEIKRIG